jgi:hypothetical protein
LRVLNSSEPSASSTTSHSFIPFSVTPPRRQLSPWSSLEMINDRPFRSQSLQPALSPQSQGTTKRPYQFGDRRVCWQCFEQHGARHERGLVEQDSDGFFPPIFAGLAAGDLSDRHDARPGRIRDAGAGVSGV